MALSIQNNIASLVAQTNLNKSSSALNTSLQRLSSGLKINTGADGPAALIISNEHGPRSRASSRPSTTPTRPSRWCRPAKAPWPR
jgi:hypothetical protein